MPLKQLQTLIYSVRSRFGTGKRKEIAAELFKRPKNLINEVKARLSRCPEVRLLSNKTSARRQGNAHDRLRLGPRWK